MKTKTLVLLLLLVVTLFAQGKKKKKEQKPDPVPEARWICRIGSYHDCHCLAMAAEANEEYIKHCQGEKDYAACMAKAPSNCDVIQKPDQKHPEHSCKRTCKAMAGCQCDDGPVCKGPIVYHPQDDSSDETQQN